MFSKLKDHRTPQASLWFGAALPISGRGMMGQIGNICLGLVKEAMSPVPVLQPSAYDEPPGREIF